MSSPTSAPPLAPGRPPRPGPQPIGRAPRTVGETGINRKFLEDLALKACFVLGEISLRDLATHVRLDLHVVDELFGRLRKEQWCEVTGMIAGVHRIVASASGRARAQELMAVNPYVGPAPVPLSAYVAGVRAQTVRDLTVDRAQVEQAFAHLVLDAETLTQLGTAITSGRSIFLYGPPGAGKTTIAENLWRLFATSEVWVPHAVEVGGDVITVYDPGVHRQVEQPDALDTDPRWVLCQRPRVIAGGELTIEMLDVQYNPATRIYAAPVQLRANNGLLIIDDFGRQRVRPEALLNRWVVPLDRAIDFLSLAGGRKIEVPFDMLVVFATNMNPSTLVDEAFLRRIQTKIHLGDTPAAHFHEIFRRVCHEMGLAYRADLVDRVIATISRELRQPLRACHPRDLVHQIIWTARFEQREPVLDEPSLDLAIRAYFLPPVPT